MEFGFPRAPGVGNRDVVDGVLVGEKRQGQGGDAGESGRQEAQVGQRDLAAERPQAGIQVGDFRAGEPFGKFADEPFRRHPQQFVPALFAGARPDDLVDVRMLVEVGDEVGDLFVRVGEVGVRPDDDPAPRFTCTDPPGRAGAAVAAKRDDPHLRVFPLSLPKPGESVVGGFVVDGDEFVAVSAGVHRRDDPLDLQRDVVFLVVTGQDDRDVEVVLLHNLPSPPAAQLRSVNRRSSRVESTGGVDHQPPARRLPAR